MRIFLWHPCTAITTTRAKHQIRDGDNGDEALLTSHRSLVSIWDIRDLGWSKPYCEGGRQESMRQSVVLPRHKAHQSRGGAWCKQQQRLQVKRQSLGFGFLGELDPRRERDETWSQLSVNRRNKMAKLSVI
ncbi:hypothetical protein V6N13_054198 [Hibiscus sabdariffa]|uniref:Uncharacterized protein n=1 Tax=Hibiscus sabdariffa TaxID=183260 RepID=A0ABR2DYI8_9ROSI